MMLDLATGDLNGVVVLQHSHLLESLGLLPWGGGKIDVSLEEIASIDIKTDMFQWRAGDRVLSILTVCDRPEKGSGPALLIEHDFDDIGIGRRKREGC